MHDVVKVPAGSGDYTLVLCKGELEASQYRSLSGTSGRKDTILLLNLYQYYYEDLYLKLCQTVDPAYQLQNVWKIYPKNWTQSLYEQRILQWTDPDYGVVKR